MKNSDSISSVALFALGLGFVGGGLKSGIGQLNTPGAGFFPMVMGVVMSVMSAALFVQSRLRRAQDRPEVSLWLKPGSWRKIAMSLVSLVFTMAALDSLGYIATTFLFILSLFKWVSAKRWPISLLMAFLLSAGSYLLFKTGLGVSLPMGLIKF
ncbi:MAG: tripartite tricarboxylate transporter TctB family protein [Deltaproteobacteria bacterium]|nr:tripartite tricarboxylate transporter TctB family protein [Deltaproteobacteria bacterium]